MKLTNCIKRLLSALLVFAITGFKTTLYWGALNIHRFEPLNKKAENSL